MICTVIYVAFLALLFFILFQKLPVFYKSKSKYIIPVIKSSGRILSHMLMILVVYFLVPILFPFDTKEIMESIIKLGGLPYLIYVGYNFYTDCKNSDMFEYLLNLGNNSSRDDIIVEYKRLERLIKYDSEVIATFRSFSPLAIALPIVLVFIESIIEFLKNNYMNITLGALLNVFQSNIIGGLIAIVFCIYWVMLIGKFGRYRIRLYYLYKYDKFLQKHPQKPIE